MDAKPIEVDAAGRLLTHLPCVRCRYDLLGAEAEGRCPECGLAIGRSTRGSWLRYCDPDWLQTVWGGLNRLAVVIVCGLVLAGLIYSGWMTNFRHGIPEWLVIIVPLLFFCTGVVVGVRGVWVATAPEPDQLRSRGMGHPARLCRGLLIASVAAWPLAVVGGAVADWQFYWREPFLAPWLLLIASMVCLLFYAWRLVLRVPNVPLAVTCVLTALIALVVWTLTLWLSDDWFGWLSLIDAWVTGLRGGIWSSPIWEYYQEALRDAYLATLAVIAFLPVLFVWFYVVLLREARKARATWAAQPWVRSQPEST